MKIKNKIKHYFEYGWLTGHITIGNLTIFGRNAMHWGVTLWTKKYGYICFRLPFTCEGKWYPMYLYFSPCATPWASTFMIGKEHRKDEWAKSRIRRLVLGHNFNSDEWNMEYEVFNSDILNAINNMVSTTKYSYAKYAKEHEE